MPAVNKTLPPKPIAAKPSGNGSILSRSRPIKEVVDDHVHLLLYGRNRIGKSTLACEFPKPLYLIPLEPAPNGGARSVLDVEGVTVPPEVPVRTSKEVEAIGIELQNDTYFKTVVLDSGTSLDAIILAEVCGWSETITMNRWGKVSRDQYTERSETMRRILRVFLGLKKHVVICCNEKDHNTKEGDKPTASGMVHDLQYQSFFAAEMGGATTRWTQDGCDFICQLQLDKEIKVETKTRKVPVAGGKPITETYEEEVDTGRLIRKLRMKQHPNYSAGSRSCYEEIAGIPDFVYGESPTEMYNEFMKVAIREKAARKG